MENLTRWHPDTCSCVLVYATDPANPEAEPVVSAVENACDEHQADTPREVFQAVLAENRLKNGAVGMAAELAAVEPMAINWSLDQDRAVCLSIPGVEPPTEEMLSQGSTRSVPTGGVEGAPEGDVAPTTDPVTIQAALDEAFGVGRVRLV
jgi:hypothetical protein